MNRKILMVCVVLTGIPATVAAQIETRASARSEVAVDRGDQRASGALEGTASATASGGAEAASGHRGGEAVLATTIESGLPQAPVRSVIAQGRARGASAAQIDRAALAVQSRLRASAAALRSGEQRAAASDADVVAGAEALAMGARPGDLERIRGAAPAGRSMTASLRALAELTASGMAPTRAASELAAHLGAGRSDAEIVRLTGRLAAAARVTGSPGALSGGARGALGATAAGGRITGGLVAGASGALIR